MSATEGEDFNVTMTTQTISFDMNEQTKNYSVTIRPDEIPEGVESFNLIVAAAAGSTLKPSQIPETTVFIIDNDGMLPRLQRKAVLSFVGLRSKHSEVTTLPILCIYFFQFLPRIIA